MPRSSRLAAQTRQSEALLVRRVAFGDADLMLTIFSRDYGLIQGVAKGARRSRRRFGGLEALHLLHARWKQPEGRDLGWFEDITVVRPRLRIVSDLASVECSGTALRWLRSAVVPHDPSLELWVEINTFLDVLDEPPSGAAEAQLASFGLRLVRALGWGLELERCVRCGLGCEPGASAGVRVLEGGLVCRACGGSGRNLRGPLRMDILRVLTDSEARVSLEHAREAVALVDDCLQAHGAR